MTLNLNSGNSLVSYVLLCVTDSKTLKVWWLGNGGSIPSDTLKVICLGPLELGHRILASLL